MLTQTHDPTPQRSAKAPSRPLGAKQQNSVSAAQTSLDNQTLQSILAARRPRQMPMAPVDDSSEREAQNIAIKIVTESPAASSIRRCACGGIVHEDGECARCRAERQPGPTIDRGFTPPFVQNVIQSHGQQLDPTTREWAHSHFNHDFSDVRIHTNRSAADSAERLNAEAYTIGRNIVFSAGRFAPSTSPGQKLIAHELVHVVQGGNIIRRQPNQTRADANASYGPPEQRTSSVTQEPAHVPHESGFNPCAVQVQTLTNYQLLAEYSNALSVVRAGRDAPGYFDYRNLQRRLVAERDRRVDLGHAWLATMPATIPEALYRIVDGLGGSFQVLTVNGGVASGPPENITSSPLMTRDQFDHFLSTHNVERIGANEYIMRIAPQRQDAAGPNGALGFPLGGQLFLPQFFGPTRSPNAGLLNLPSLSSPVGPEVFGEGVTVIDSWAQPFELGYGQTITRRLAAGGTVSLDAPITFDIDEPLPVGDKNIKPQRQVARALDPQNRQLLDPVTNQRTKGLGIDFRDIERGRNPLEPISVADDPSALITRRFGEVVEMRAVFDEAVARVPNRNALTPTQLKNAINANIRDIIRTGNSPSAVAVREAFRANGFEVEPTGRMAALREPPLNMGTELRGAGGEAIRGGLGGGVIAVVTAAGIMLIDSRAHPNWEQELAVSGSLGTGAGALGSFSERAITTGLNRVALSDVAATGASRITPGLATGLGRFGGGAVGAMFVEGISMGLLEGREHSGAEVGTRLVRSGALGGGSVWAGAAVGTAVGGPVGFIVGLAVGGVLYYVGDKVVPGGRDDWDAIEAGCQPRRTTTPTDDPSEHRYHWCFASGTRIDCANGVPKPIELIAEGDLILAFDSQTRQLTSAIVIRAQCHGPARCLHITLDDGNALEVTANHPLAQSTNGAQAWTEAGKLGPGDCLFSINASATAIEEHQIITVSENTAPLIIYDIAVETHHNFFANGILAHNKNI